MSKLCKCTVALLVLLLGTAAIAVAEGGQETATGEEPLVIKWFGHRGFPGDDAIIPPMLEELISEKVGYPVSFEFYGEPGLHDDINEVLTRYLAANDLPDIFNQHGTTGNEFLEQAAAPFTLEEFRTHLPEFYKAHIEFMENSGNDPEETFARYQNADGDMWGIPGVWATGWVPSGQMWRKDIVQELGFEIPSTIDEAEAVFEAYKNVYPDRYCLTGRGGIDWQCFDIVFNAFGIVGGGNNVRDGKIVQFYATREFREALTVLRRWYEKGFWDPNFINYNMEWVQNFAAGDYLVTNWIKDWNYPDGTKTRYLEPLRDIPGAMAVAATHLAADENSKPIQRVWDPYTGGIRCFAKHLLQDKDKMYRIMEVVDLAMDKEVSYLAAFGIEGEHYTIPEEGAPPEFVPELAKMQQAARVEKFGLGYYWRPFGNSFVVPMAKVEQQKLDEFVIPPDAVYGTQNLDRWTSYVTGQVIDEEGETVEAETITPWFDMVVAIMTGAEPIEYYDEWLDYYYDAGGREWERHATRLYLE